MVSVSTTQTPFFPNLLLVIIFITATKRQTRTHIMYHHCRVTLPGRAFLQVKRLYPDIAFSWGTEGLGVPLLDVLRKQTFLLKISEKEKEDSLGGIRQIQMQLPFLFTKLQLRKLYPEKISSGGQMARLQNTTGIKCKWSHFSLWQKTSRYR